MLLLPEWLPSRCTNSFLFGSKLLDGGQAEYVRVPFADGTVMKAPAEIEQTRPRCSWPTSSPRDSFGARNAFRLLEPMPASEATVVVVGCGPVGLCAIIAALERKPKRSVRRRQRRKPAGAGQGPRRRTSELPEG